MLSLALWLVNANLTKSKSKKKRRPHWFTGRADADPSWKSTEIIFNKKNDYSLIALLGDTVFQGGFEVRYRMFVQVGRGPGGLSPGPGLNSHRPRTPGYGGPVVICREIIGCYRPHGAGAVRLRPLWG